MQNLKTKIFVYTCYIMTITIMRIANAKAALVPNRKDVPPYTHRCCCCC